MELDSNIIIKVIVGLSVAFIIAAFKKILAIVKKVYLLVINAITRKFGVKRKLKNYYKRVINNCDSIQIYGMDNFIHLKQIYVEAHVLQSVSANRVATKTEIEEEIKSGKKGYLIIKEPKDALEVISKSDKVIILGKPGSGKSTFLKFLAISIIENKDRKHFVPILINLNDYVYSDCNSLFDYALMQFEGCGLLTNNNFVEDLLIAGKCSILIDGLDELTNSQRTEVVAEIRKLAKDYCENLFVVTCRSGGYQYWFEKFQVVELADFNDQQIEVFISKWFKSKPKMKKIFASKFFGDRQVRELASNPLLLTLICLAFDRTLEISKSRSSLFKEAIDAFFRDWDSSRYIERGNSVEHLNIWTGRKESLLGEIAFNTLQQQQFCFTHKELVNYILNYLKKLPKANPATLRKDSEKLLKDFEVHHGIFVNQAKDLYSYSHIVLQEYFAAKHILDTTHKRSLEKLIQQHLFDTKWRDIILIVAEMLSDADKYVNLIQKQIKKLTLQINKIGILSVDPSELKFIEEKIVALEDSSRNSIPEAFKRSIGICRKILENIMFDSSPILNEAFYYAIQIMKIQIRIFNLPLAQNFKRIIDLSESWQTDGKSSQYILDPLLSRTIAHNDN